MAIAVDPAVRDATTTSTSITRTRRTGSARPDRPTIPVNRVSRFVYNTTTDKIDQASEIVLIDNIPAPAQYHIGADLEFGKDGFLYVSTGDGGCDWQAPANCLGANDASRDEHVLLGKVLRITRDGEHPAPPTRTRVPGTARCNVTGSTTAGNKCQETYARGPAQPVPHRQDPNAAGTRMFINDVGELKWEEIDELASGADYGWNVREGSARSTRPPTAGLRRPG